MVALNAFRENQEARPVDKVKASTLAGGIAGVVGGALREWTPRAVKSDQRLLTLL